LIFAATTRPDFGQIGHCLPRNLRLFSIKKGFFPFYSVSSS